MIQNFAFMSNLLYIVVSKIHVWKVQYEDRSIDTPACIMRDIVS